MHIDIACIYHSPCPLWANIVPHLSGRTGWVFSVTWLQDYTQVGGGPQHSIMLRGQDWPTDKALMLNKTDNHMNLAFEGQWDHAPVILKSNYRKMDGAWQIKRICQAEALSKLTTCFWIWSQRVQSNCPQNLNSMCSSDVMSWGLTTFLWRLRTPLFYPLFQRPQTQGKNITASLRCAKLLQLAFHLEKCLP